MERVLHSFSPCSGEEAARGLELRVPIQYTGIVMPNQALSACLKKPSKQASNDITTINSKFVHVQTNQQ